MHPTTLVDRQMDTLSCPNQNGSNYEHMYTDPTEMVGSTLAAHLCPELEDWWWWGVNKLGLRGGGGAGPAVALASETSPIVFKLKQGNGFADVCILQLP